VNIQAKSEQELTTIIRNHFRVNYSVADCLNIIETLVIRKQRDILTPNNKALIAKLEAPSEHMAPATEPDQPAAALEA
jgi:hypothetical protein